MLYTVEMALTENDPDDVWEQWVSDMKPLETFATVPGFLSVQRLKGIASRPTPSLGYYLISSVDVLDSDEYLANNGRKMNTPSWRPRMSYWYRNLFDSDKPILPVMPGSVLFTLDAPEPGALLGDLSMNWLTAVGLDRTTPYRGLAIVNEEHAAPYLALERGTPGLTAFRPKAAPLRFTH